jgi:hypothetical protein
MTAPVKVGRYEIVRRLGRSMTDVYLAIDTVENRKAALKLIPSDGDAASRLVLEAERRGAAIQKELHVLDPRVIEIYDFGDADGYFFVAMQYVEGRNLAEVLHTERVLDPVRAAAIALEICEQLAKFHSWQSAVVHGDIKPSNIHLGNNGTVRLLDFGIAKTLRLGRDATDHDFGSPSYCSPERLTRSQVDQQSDLWAVGATLYEMLAGAPPFQAEDTRKLEALIRSRRAPRALPPGCPRALRAVAMKALAPNAEQRYRSAREFQLDLQAFLEHKPTLAEMEQAARWSPSATIEAAREYLRRKATRTARRIRPKLRIAGAVVWFGAGMALWIGGQIAWQALEAARAAATPMPLPPAPKPELAELYVAAADRILDSYRTSEDASLDAFDWQKAELCLGRAVELRGISDELAGKLALARGYGILQRLGGMPYSTAAAYRLRVAALDQFSEAERKMPRDPAPRLALARLYVYYLPSVEKAMAEFAAAELLGAAPGRREIAQQADAYRMRALQESAASPRSAWQDAEAARALYGEVRGYGDADGRLRQLDRIRQPVAKKAKYRKVRRWR